MNQQFSCGVVERGQGDLVARLCLGEGKLRQRQLRLRVEDEECRLRAEFVFLSSARRFFPARSTETLAASTVSFACSNWWTAFFTSRVMICAVFVS
jgi:hypothetical protein